MNNYLRIARNLNTQDWQAGDTFFNTWYQYLAAENIRAEYPGVPFFKSLMEKLSGEFESIMPPLLLSDVIRHCEERIKNIPQEDLTRSIVWQPTDALKQLPFYNKNYISSNTLNIEIIEPILKEIKGHVPIKLLLENNKKSNIQPHILLCYFNIAKGKKTINHQSLEEYALGHNLKIPSFISAYHTKVKKGVLQNFKISSFREAIQLSNEDSTKEQITIAMNGKIDRNK